MKPILLIILLVAACYYSQKRFDSVEPYRIQLEINSDSICTVKGFVYGQLYYDKFSAFPADTTGMINEAENTIFAVMKSQYTIYPI